MSDEKRGDGPGPVLATRLPSEIDLWAVHEQLDAVFADPDAPIPYRLTGAVLAPVEGNERP